MTPNRFERFFIWLFTVTGCYRKDESVRLWHPLAFIVVLILALIAGCYAFFIAFRDVYKELY